MKNPSDNLPIIIGVSGASGSVFAIRLLEILRELGVPTHLVMSKAAELALSLETNYSAKQVKALADHVYKVHDVGAAIASGSFLVRGMIIAPCSVRTWSEIATGVTSSLLTRAADVTLKENRRLVLMVRESPLHLGHLRSLTQLAEMGAVIAPPVPAFYLKPENLTEMVDQTLDRVLDQFGLARNTVKRWEP
ncbi:Flavin prenyltransferase UbiX [hydrothermal vent metagenome]|uniref:flavin prenyltransferase n=1 Tax=hydrothermal vent metagenome TaxID=652676 RepID=A0A3B0RA01_9ZZZZ